MAKPLLDQEGCNLHAARTVVAKAGNWTLTGKVLQPRRHGAHGNGQQLKAIWRDAGGLHFPGFANIEHDRCTLGCMAGRPSCELRWLNLIDHVASLKVKAGRFGKTL